MGIDSLANSGCGSGIPRLSILGTLAYGSDDIFFADFEDFVEAVFLGLSLGAIATSHMGGVLAYLWSLDPISVTIYFAAEV